MQSVTLDDFMALNEQLAALIEAGVPLDIGLSQRDQPAANELQRINAIVARRMNRGETLDEALQGDEQDVPAAYRSMVELGVRTAKLPAALDGSSRIAESVDESRFTFESAFFYPLVVCALAYVGLVGFSLFLVPTLEGMHESMRIDPGPGLRTLQLLRDTLPYWVAIPPILLLLLVWWARSKWRQATAGAAAGEAFRWLPGLRRIASQQRAAQFATSLAELLENQTPLHEALTIAGDASGNSLRDGAKSLGADVQKGQWPADTGPIGLRFPPFLRWAIWHSDAVTDRARALRIVARIYDDASKHRAQRLRTIAPMAALVLVGGAVTLLYGLALFVPVIEMLRALAR